MANPLNAKGGSGRANADENFATVGALTHSGRGVERTGESRGQDPVVSMCLNAKGGMGRIDAESETFVVGSLQASGKAAGSCTQQDAECGMLIAHSLSSEGADASEDGTGRGTPLVAHTVTAGIGRDWNNEVKVASHLVAFDTTQITHPVNRSNPQPGDPCHPLAQSAHAPAIAFDARQSDVIEYGEKSGPLDTDGHTVAVAFSCKDSGSDAAEEIALTLRAMRGVNSADSGTGMAAVAFTERTRKGGRSLECQEDLAYALTNPGSGGRTHSRQIQNGMMVRRLTPRECERLQGFPDDYTLIPYRGKPACDGPRYRAIGNSFAVPVVRYLGRRIQMVEEILRRKA